MRPLRFVAHSMALTPTRAQERLLWERVGYARFAANRAIEDFRDGLAAGEWHYDKTFGQDGTLARQGSPMGRSSQPERGQECHT